jgi:hypothetical protein
MNITFLVLLLLIVRNTFDFNEFIVNLLTHCTLRYKVDK